MAVGDDAVAAGMDVVPGTALANTIDTELNKTRDYIAQRTSAVTPVEKGGTGATNAAAARTNLGLGSSAQQAAGSYVTNQSNPANLIGLSWSGGRVNMAVDGTNQGAIVNTGDLAGKADASALADKVSKSGDTITGNLFLPNSSAASSGWTAAYINGDGRVCRGSSSQRYKKFINPHDPLALGDIWPAFVRYKMRADGITPAENVWRYGYIVEQMAQEPDQAPFVVWRDIDGETVPDSIDEIGLLKAQTAQLHRRALAAEARADALEARLAAIEAALGLGQEA